MKGKVYLVGAGPGDPELMTLRAARLLREADVVLADDLVSEECFQGISARVVRVGKRAGSCKSTPQRFIERLAIWLARRGSLHGPRATAAARRLDDPGRLSFSHAFVRDPGRHAAYAAPGVRARKS